MSPTNCPFQIAGCTAFKMEGIFHDITRNQTKTEGLYTESLSKMTEVIMEFMQSFWPRLGANTIKHISELELYIFSTTLENYECWNQTLLIMKCHHIKQSRFNVLLQWQVYPQTKFFFNTLSVSLALCTIAQDTRWNENSSIQKVNRMHITKYSWQNSFIIEQNWL